MVERDEFGQLVRDALTHLYDSTHLQTHPLIGLLDLESPAWGTAAEALRALLRDAIDSLKPPPSVPVDRPEWLGYTILWLRYVRLCSEAEVCQELGISVATLYRRQREATDALTSVLWSRHLQAMPHAEAPPDQDVASMTAGQARLRAIRLAGSSARQPVDLASLLEGVRRIVLPLASERGATLSIDVPPALPRVYAHASVLRQVFLAVFAEGIRMSPGRALVLEVRSRSGQVLTELRGLPAQGEPTSPTADRSALSMSEALLEPYGGRLWFREDPAGGYALLVALPAGARRVLVIDDDAATVALYRRYLEREGYIVLDARTPEQAESLLAGFAPDVILLDVLMPETDGWTALQTLKANPRTAHIPVVVCSVIEQPDLAIRLGAARVLTKPISPHDLVGAIGSQLPSPGPADRDRA